jgi:hypothetical protein
MVRAFKRIKEDLNCGEVIEVNVITGDYKSFYYNIVNDDQLFIFGEHKDNVFKMGWKSVNQFIKNRMKGYRELKNGFEYYNLPRYDYTKYTFQERCELLNKISC